MKKILIAILVLSSFSVYANGVLVYRLLDDVVEQVKAGEISKVSIISEKIESALLNRVLIATDQNKQCTVDVENSSAAFLLAKLIKSNMNTIRIICMVQNHQLRASSVTTKEYRVSLE